ncbi:MAG: DUF4347 domain-containing protein, partial [Alphaproteobacteria bacterium]|nr:DUF4347 domain-containing protein [Alphaproteobacteria bacterium]
MGNINRKRRRTSLGLLALEPRWMFDGAAMADAADAAPAPVEVHPADPSRNDGKREVVFVDTSVAGYQTLEAAVKAGVAIVEIDGGASGLAQIAKWAESHTGYDSISILSHGGKASVRIGTDTLSNASLTNAAVQAELAQIGHSLKADGDLLLYGCDVAKGVDGRRFIDGLAAATGADVAASTDTTGAAARGGDWTLEKATGDIRATMIDGGTWDGDLGWTAVGSASGISSGQASYQSLVVASDGTPYLAFQDSNAYGVTVMKYSSGAWANVGNAGFAGGTAEHISLAVASDGTPYVAFMDKDFMSATINRATVMKYSGGAWTVVGNAGLSAGTASFLSLAIAADGTPYLAYQDGSQDSYNATVMKYSDGAWSAVGAEGFTTGQADYASLKFAPDGTPYLAFQDYASDMSVTVMKYSGGAWSIVGEAGLTAANATYQSLAFAPDGTPYVAFADGANGNKATAMKYSDGAWSVVGSAGFTGGATSYTSLAFSPDGTPYVGYADYGSSFMNYYAGVEKYSDGAWTTVGVAQISLWKADYESLAIDSSGNVYIAYQDQINGSKAAVKVFAAPIVNTAPTFVTPTDQSLSLPQDSAAVDLKPYLHANDADASQTETWSQSVAPSHGTLSFADATAASGSADITPGGTITYTPTTGYSGTDPYTIHVSAGQGGTAALVFNDPVTVNTAPTFVTPTDQSLSLP